MGIEKMTATPIADLHAAISGMELPEQRRTATEPSDLRWLGRNMALHNRDHPGLTRALTALRTVLGPDGGMIIGEEA